MGAMPPQQLLQTWTNDEVTHEQATGYLIQHDVQREADFIKLLNLVSEIQVLLQKFVAERSESHFGPTQKG